MHTIKMSDHPMLGGNQKRAIAITVVNKNNPEAQHIRIALPQHSENVRGSRTTFLISRFPDPRLANGETIAARDTTPTNAPYSPGPKSRAISTKYTACTPMRSPEPRNIQPEFRANALFRLRLTSFSQFRSRDLKSPCKCAPARTRETLKASQYSVLSWDASG